MGRFFRYWSRGALPFVPLPLKCYVPGRGGDAAFAAIQLGYDKIDRGGINGGVFAVDAAKVFELVNYTHEAETNRFRHFYAVF